MRHPHHPDSRQHERPGEPEQQHAGVVHSSNLCTEITLNTSKDEVAVCNLASVNLAQHVSPEGLDVEIVDGGPDVKPSPVASSRPSSAASARSVR